MLGILLNSLKRAQTAATVVGGTVNFKQQIFGKGTTSYTVAGETIDGGTLSSRNNQSLEFANLTINSDARVFSPQYLNGWTNVPGRYAPLYIKCSDTLTVNGSLDADGAGAISYPGDDITLRIPQYAPVPVNQASDRYGTSADFESFTRLQNYGATAGFFNFGTYLSGGGGAGLRTSNHNHHSRIAGISAGGGTGGNGASSLGGGGGGFVAVYYKELWINGKQYGVDAGCEIWRVQASGQGGLSYPNGGFGYGIYGGGSIIVAAKKLVIGSTGKITANGLAPAWRPNQGSRFCFMNNIPQLGPQVFYEGSGSRYWQTGVRWNYLTNMYDEGTALGNDYYYDDGTGKGTPNQKYNSGQEHLVGGAGIALGFKVL